MNTRPAVRLAILVIISLLSVVFVQAGEAFNESPMFTEKVKKGELDPVEQRLPESPPTVKPVDRIGIYGGSWRRACYGLSDLTGVKRLLYDPLLRWSPNFKLEPNIAHSWDVDDEMRVFTLYLVSGIRWSDGTPFTAEDVVFAANDILLNPDVTALRPHWLCPLGTVPRVEALDRYTVRFSFNKPYGLFLEQLACMHGMELVTKPKHYLKRFHPKYADPDELVELIEEGEKQSLWRLIQEKSGMQARFTTTEVPTILAWITEHPAPAKQFAMVRNPYYWKVDPKGNQLPYIDRIVHTCHRHSKTIMAAAISGNIDMQGRKLGGIQNAALLLANRAIGNYHLVPKYPTASVGLVLAPNLNHEDQVLNELLSQRDFRIALSHAINREAINKIVYLGKGTPRQAAPLKASPFYRKEYEEAYIEFDRVRADALLDKLGVKRNGSGMRVRSDGKPLRLNILVLSDMTGWGDTAELIAEDLRNVGIEAGVREEPREVFRHIVKTAQHDLVLWPGDGGLHSLLDPRWYFPYSWESLHAPLFGEWYRSWGRKGVQPPEDLRELMEIYNHIQSAATESERVERFTRILKANEKNLWVLGLVKSPPDYYVVHNRFHNVPERDYQGWIYPNPGPIHPEQFFIQEKKP